MSMGTFKTQMLWDSIRNGNLAATVQLLENGTINPEERDDKGQTFLMLACECGEVEIVREILEFIDVNCVDNDNWTALMFAAKAGHLEILIELLDKGADFEHRDLGGWTALMWACYKGKEEIVMELLDRGASPNIKAEFNMTCLSWAAGRGHTSIVSTLISNGAKVNIADKYGTTPLIWACRKGYLEIVENLLTEGASVEVTGMNSWTALLVATKGGFSEIVSALLEYDPNVNAVDKDGFSALTVAAKEGYLEIAHNLLAKGAYVNIADRAGDTILIHAVKSGHVDIVRAMLNKYADVDVQGSEGKTALYWAVEKNHVDILRSLLDNDPELEQPTKDEDTALLKAVRNRNEQCVRLLLDKGAKVSAIDKRGDTALHISLRARSKRITELLLRNPRNSRLLYRSNKSGETPYNIDTYHQKGILSQIFGHRNLNASDGENLLGYDIYSSALADILSDPSLNTPITVGLYAKWGSGKSFLLSKLQKEMKSFTKESVDEHFTFCWAIFFVLLIINNIVGVSLALAVDKWEIGLGLGLGLFPIEYAILGIIYVCARRFELRYAVRASFILGRKLLLLTLLLKVLFCYPKQQSQVHVESQTVKFLFSESTRLVSVGGEKSLAAMVGTLGHVLELEYGFLVARLFRVFKPNTAARHTGRFKSLCCIPYFVIVIFVILCLGVGITLLVLNDGISKETPVMATMITLASIVGLAIISNVYTWGQALLALFKSQQSRILKAADNIEVMKMDGLMQKLKLEVDLMSNMVTCMDKFTTNQTRLVVIVDGLDSCEQDKVLQVLDIIKALFSDEDSPVVTILAVDPQIIIKGIESNLKLSFNDSNVNGFDYLRNAVHLPFYLQSQGMRIKKQDLAISPSPGDNSPTRQKTFQHQDSVWSSYSGIDQKPKSKNRHIMRQESTMTHTSSLDLTHSLNKNDYFSDINPRSMRRLLNIVAVTGRLLRAYNIEFSWHRLASWTNIVEQWPYRVSWIIVYFEDNEMLDDGVTLMSMYKKVVDKLPISREIEPLLEIDRNARKLEAFLCQSAGSGPVLNVGDLKKFLPCTVNLDPYLRKLIRDLLKSTENMQLGPMYPMSPSANSSHLTINGHMNNQIMSHMTGQSILSDPPQRRRKTSGNTQNPGLSADNGTMPFHMSTPYGPMPMYNPWYMGFQGPFQPSPHGVKEKGSTVKEIHIEGYRKKKLSTLSVEEICDVLSKTQGILKSSLSQYQDVIRENNVCGEVLSTCELDELRGVFSMKFGDWQLFKSAVLSLRRQEEELEREDTFHSDGVQDAAGSRKTSITNNQSDRDNCDSPDYQIPEDSGRRKSILVSSESSSKGHNSYQQERKKSVHMEEDKKFTAAFVGDDLDGSFDSQRSIGANRSDRRRQFTHSDSVSSSALLYKPKQITEFDRKNSYAKQTAFEQGLLHKAMMHFTEENESEYSDDERSLTDAVDLEKYGSVSGSPPPVKFDLYEEDSDVLSAGSSVGMKETYPLLSFESNENNSGVDSKQLRQLERQSGSHGSGLSLSKLHQELHISESPFMSQETVLNSDPIVRRSASLNVVDETAPPDDRMSQTYNTSSSKDIQEEDVKTFASFELDSNDLSSSLPDVALRRIGLQKYRVSFDKGTKSEDNV